MQQQQQQQQQPPHHRTVVISAMVVDGPRLESVETDRKTDGDDCDGLAPIWQSYYRYYRYQWSVTPVHRAKELSDTVFCLENGDTCWQPLNTAVTSSRRQSQQSRTFRSEILYWFISKSVRVCSVEWNDRKLDATPTRCLYSGVTRFRGEVDKCADCRYFIRQYIY